jgi:hypothetical protein
MTLQCIYIYVYISLSLYIYILIYLLLIMGCFGPDMKMIPPFLKIKSVVTVCAGAERHNSSNNKWHAIVL